MNHTKNKKAVGIFVCTENKDSTLIQGVILCASSQVVWSFFAGNHRTQWKLFLCHVWRNGKNPTCVAFWSIQILLDVVSLKPFVTRSPLQHFDHCGVGGWIQTIPMETKQIRLWSWEAAHATHVTKKHTFFIIGTCLIISSDNNDHPVTLWKISGTCPQKSTF